MADNVPITAGTGTDVATDQVTSTGEHVQLFKLAIATDGSRVLIPADATNGLLVDVSRVKPDGTNVMPSLDNIARAGFFKITDGTSVVGIDTVHNDGESATENHLMVGARNSGINHLGTFDSLRASVGVNKTAQYTAAQTGTALWTPAAGKAVVITQLQIQSGGTTAGTCIVWFGGAADTAYTRGTDFPIFDGEWNPTASNKPGMYVTFPTPIRGTADFVLRVTTTNAQTVTISVWGYEI